MSVSGVSNPRGDATDAADGTTEAVRQSALLKAGALQNAILTSANFSIIATDEKGIIQMFNVGAERMLGYMAAEVVNKINPSDIHVPLTAHIPVVALSTNAIPRDIEHGLAAGFFRYLTKPIKINEFMNMLDVTLQYAKAQSAHTDKVELL